jgi:hypothetical protein
LVRTLLWYHRTDSLPLQLNQHWTVSLAPMPPRVRRTGMIANGFMGMRDNDANMRLKYSPDLILFPDCLSKLGVAYE